MSEKNLKANGIRYQNYKLDMNLNNKSITNGDDIGFISVYVRQS